MNKVYFVRHAKPDFSVYDDLTRPLTKDGIEDFNTFSKNQWEDFNHKLENGESLKEVQERNIKELNKILRENDGESIVIGTHGTSLSCIINYFDKSFGYMQFEEIKNVMPLIIIMEFKGLNILNYSVHEY